MMGRLTCWQVEKLEGAGGKRWTEGDMDRVYLDPTKLGLEVEFRRSGKVESASFDGTPITDDAARHVLNSRVYVDVASGRLYTLSDFADEAVWREVVRRARAILDAVRAEGPGTPDEIDGCDAALAYAGERAAAVEERAAWHRAAAEEAPQQAERLRAGDVDGAWEFYRRHAPVVPRWPSRRGERPDEKKVALMTGDKGLGYVAEQSAEWAGRAEEAAARLRAWRPSPWRRVEGDSYADAAGDLVELRPDGRWWLSWDCQGRRRETWLEVEPPRDATAAVLAADREMVDSLARQ